MGLALFERGTVARMLYSSEMYTASLSESISRPLFGSLIRIVFNAECDPLFVNLSTAFVPVVAGARSS